MELEVEANLKGEVKMKSKLQWDVQAKMEVEVET